MEARVIQYRSLTGRRPRPSTAVAVATAAVAAAACCLAGEMDMGNNSVLGVNLTTGTSWTREQVSRALS